MYKITIANDTVKRYKLQWHNHNGRRNSVIKRRVLHGISLDDVKAKALRIYGVVPDSIQRI